MRTQSSWAAFSRLQKRLWGKRSIRLLTKLKIYQAVVLLCLLYSDEAYTLYRRHIKRLSSVHLKQLRTLLGIRYTDRITKNEVLSRANSLSILLNRQLRWTGHVRMEDDRLPKSILYGQTAIGRRNVSHLRLRYLDCTKRHLKVAKIDVNSWEALATYRLLWQVAVRDGTIAAEVTCLADAEVARQRRHAACTTANIRPLPFACRHCGRSIAARIGLSSHERACSRTANTRSDSA